MGYDMIAKVGKLLVEVLGRELVPDVLLHKNSIGLCTPGERGDFKLGIYLYDIQENQDVRASGMVNAGLHTQTYPPVYLTLSYMITAYSDSDIAYRVQEEQRILGRVIQVLRDYSVFSPAELGGGVDMPAQISFVRLEAHERENLWNHTNLPAKLSLFYRIQPVEIPSGRTREVSRVRDVDFQMEKDGKPANAQNRPPHLHASLTVLVIDDYTGKPVQQKDITLRVPGQAPPQVKGGGYYVFVNVTQPEIQIICESRIYFPRTKYVGSETGEAQKVQILRLMPKAEYPTLGKATALSGRAKPGENFFIWKREGEGYRLSKNLGGEEGVPDCRIAIYNPEDRMLEGKGFYILDRDTGDKEFFRITGEEGGYFCMDRPLQGKYKKMRTSILPVYEVQADERGEVFVLFAGEAASKFEVVCQSTGDGKKVQLSLRRGRVKKVKL